MKITVLSDNNTFIDHYYVGEPALSFYIEDEDLKMLFDTGYSDTFIQNAESLNIDLSEISMITFSHEHNDHTRGMIFLENYISSQIQIIAHPDIFLQRFENNKSIGAPFSFDQMKNKYSLILSKKPIRINKRLTFLGEIPCYLEFEKRQQIGVLNDFSTGGPDYVMDDTALAYNTGNGLFIITGCSHSGICNIIEHAKYICNEKKITGIIGGFHLLSVSDRLDQTIAYFKENNIKDLYPCHCVSFAAKAEIHKHVSIHEVGVGLSINI